MNPTIRHKIVSVAIVHDPDQGFLLWNNSKWLGYAFPMKHLEPDSDPVTTAEQAVLELPGDLVVTDVKLLEHVGWCGWSPNSREHTYYDYHVHEVRVQNGPGAIPMHPDLRFHSDSAIRDGENVTESTKFVAQCVVESQDVAMAVIKRDGAHGPEFLVTYSSAHKYSLPCARLDTRQGCETVACDAVRLDSGYEGPLEAVSFAEVPRTQPSQRFGTQRRNYRLHLCWVTLPNVNLAQPANALQASLEDMANQKAQAGFVPGDAGYWAWFTEDDFRSRGDISATMEAVLLTILQSP